MNENLKDTIADELGIESSELTNEKLLDEIESWDSVTLLILSVIISDEAGTPITPIEMRELVENDQVGEGLEGTPQAGMGPDPLAMFAQRIGDVTCVIQIVSAIAEGSFVGEAVAEELVVEGGYDGGGVLMKHELEDLPVACDHRKTCEGGIPDAAPV